MRCYFWGTNNQPNRRDVGRGLISFAIPEWGLQFRAAHDGNALECEYAALLSVMNFIEQNPKVFDSQLIELFTDTAGLIEQIEGRLPVSAEALKPWTVVKALRARIPFELVWVPPSKNRAIEGVLELPPIADSVVIRPASDTRYKPPARPKNGGHFSL